MVISIASGKGGTGKTTIAAGLANVIRSCVYIDCDVEEPNGHLLLKPEIKSIETSYKYVPKIDYELCSFCNKCIDVCEFNALVNLTNEIYLFEELCKSCGACSYFCPCNAITEIEKEDGIIRRGSINNNGLFFDAYLKIGEASASPLIKKIRNKYKGKRPVIIDSPPGTSCSMMEAVRDSDFCILVTESTPFGLNDLTLAIDVLKQIGTPFGIVINKYSEEFRQLEEFINRNNLNLLLKIPFRMDIAESYSKGELLSGSIKDYEILMSELLTKIKKEVGEVTEYA
ncbi:MAG: ATP-binding protein [Ignavibacteriaceae bacterium]